MKDEDEFKRRAHSHESGHEGRSNSHIVIARFRANGAFDPTFNKGIGKSFGYGFGVTLCSVLELESDGVFIGGEVYGRAGGRRLMLWRLNDWDGSESWVLGGQGHFIGSMPNKDNLLRKLPACG